MAGAAVGIGESRGIPNIMLLLFSYASLFLFNKLFDDDGGGGLFSRIPLFPELFDIFETVLLIAELLLDGKGEYDEERDEERELLLSNMFGLLYFIFSSRPILELLK
jgi:hypothetical protein